MLKKQPLETLPQQNQLDAYGGTEAGTSLWRTSSDILRLPHPGYRSW